MIREGEMVNEWENRAGGADLFKDACHDANVAESFVQKLRKRNNYSGEFTLCKRLIDEMGYELAHKVVMSTTYNDMIICIWFRIEHQVHFFEEYKNIENV